MPLPVELFKEKVLSNLRPSWRVKGELNASTNIHATKMYPHWTRIVHTNGMRVGQPMTQKTWIASRKINKLAEVAIALTC